MLEKKKVKDLENRLVELNRNPPPPKETATQTVASTDSVELIGKLKRLLIAVKKKHEDGLKEDTSLEIVNELQASQAKIDQLSGQLKQKENAYNELNDKLNEQTEKLRRTEETTKSQQHAFNSLQETNRKLKEELAQKQNVLLEHQSKTAQVVDQLQHLQQKNLSLDHIRNEKQEIEARFQQKQEESEKLQRILEEKDDELVNLKSVIEELRSHPKEDLNKLNRLEQHIQRSDQSLVRLQSALKEVKDEAIKYKDLYNQATTKLQSSQELQNQQSEELEKLRTEYQSVSQGDLETLNNKLQETTEQNRLLKQSLEKLSILVKDKEKRIVDLQQFEYTAKKILMQKQDLEMTSEKEKEAIRSLEIDKENLHTALSESRQHSEQLERVIQFLRERSEEAKLEAKQLREEFLGAQDTLLKVSKDLEDAKVKENQYSLLLEQEKALSHDAENEIQALRIQFDTLRIKFNEINSNLQKSTLDQQEITKVVQSLEIEKENLKQQLDQKTANFEHLQNEIAVIKQTLIRGIREAKELENRYTEAVREKVAILGKAHQLQQLSEKQSEEIGSLRDALKTSSAREQALIQSLEDQRLTMESSFNEEYKNLQQTLENKIQTMQESYQNEILSLQEQYIKIRNEQRVEKADAEAEHAMLRQNMETLHQRKIEELENKLIILSKDCSSLELRYNQKEEEIKLYREKTALLEEDKAAFSEALKETRALLDEKEQQFNGAQQHLAKKVREVAAFSEKVDELQAQISDLQSNLSILKVKNQEVQSTLDHQIQQEKRLQETLREANKSAESEFKKWEEKYAQISDKFRIAITRITELEKLEEKHFQMQNLLTNLGNVLGASPAQSQPISMTQQEQRQQPQPKKEKPQFGIRESEYTQNDVLGETSADPRTIEQREEPSRPYQNLFDMPRSSQKPKQNLFE